MSRVTSIAAQVSHVSAPVSQVAEEIAPVTPNLSAVCSDLAPVGPQLTGDVPFAPVLRNETATLRAHPDYLALVAANLARVALIVPVRAPPAPLSE